MKMIKMIIAFATATIMMGMLPLQATAYTSEKSLDEVIAGDHRSVENKARDQYRHPKETLEFFGLKANMTVVEIWPGGSGWYQEILAPYLNDQGVYYSAGGDLASTSAYVVSANEKIAARLAAYDKAVITEMAPPTKYTIAPAGSADMVLSFRNFHNWQMGGFEREAMTAIYAALKPGGIFGITDHRSEATNGKDGYIKPSYLLELAKEVGFTLVAKSEINANPKDDHQHERGVWTLPPRLAGKAEDHDKMKAIGESDRLTFKFMKPVK